MDVIKKIIRNTLLPTVCLTALLPLFVNASDASTYLEGEFNVSGGQADYQLPINIAPGRAGHAPNLSLAYSSDNPNGILGVGWQLRGLSSIYRCGKNLTFDGNWGGVNLDSDDQYCIDGQRLIPITGNAGADGTEYRTRINDQRKIISFGKKGSGPQSFKVWSKDGQLFEYGNNATARPELAGKSDVYKWSLSKISDITRNNHIHLTYYYDKNGGHHRLQEITYVGGKVSFNYEVRDDTQFSYLSGSKLNANHRLSSIVSTTDDGDEVAQYSFSYQYSSGTSRSQLTTITHSVDGVESVPVNFTWQSQVGAQFDSNKAVFDHTVRRSKFYDIGRDGNVEIFSNSKDPKQVVVNSDSGKKISGSMYSNFGMTTDFVIADWSGNNQPSYKILPILSWVNTDSYFSYPDGNGGFKEFYTRDINEYGWATSKKYPRDTNGNGVFTLESRCENCSYYDFNGDGKTIEYLKYSNGVLTYNNGSKTQTVFSGSEKKQLLQVADFNNDGYLDLLIGNLSFVTSNKSDSVSNKLKVYYFTGSEFKFNGDELQVTYNTSLKTETYDCSVGDKDKTCYRYYHNFSPDEAAIVDINSDGLLDIVYADKSFINKNGMFSNNAVSSRYSKLDIHEQADVQIVDVNSNGWPDNFHGSNIKRSKAFAQDRIKTISEYSVSYSLAYKPLSDPDIHKQIPYYNYPVVNSTPTKYVVSQFEVTPRGYSPVKTTYFYHGAKSHLKGEGFLGFAQIDRTRHGVNKEKTVTTFEQIDPIIAGRVKEITTYRNDAKYLKESNTYKTKSHSGVGAKYYTVTRSDHKSYVYNKAGQVEKQTVREFEYDNFGNITEKTADITSGISGGGSFTEKASYEYLSSGSITKSTVLSATSSSIASSLFTKYDSFQMWCTANGTQYIKPTDEFVLIHGDISIPLITKRYNEYYRLDTRSTSSSNGVSVIKQVDFVSVSESSFNAANASPCGSYVVVDHDGNGQLDLSTSKKTVTQLLTESGDNYWKVSAPDTVTSAIKDNGANSFSKTNITVYRYDSNGLLLEELITPGEYESGDSFYGNTSKQVVNRYRYDPYGNLVDQENGGTDAQSRSTTTVYDSKGLFSIRSTNAGNLTTTFEHDARFGLVTKSVSPVKGRTTSWSYDGFGRARKENRPGRGDFTDFEYRLGNQCIKSTSRTVSCIIAKNANGNGGVYQTVTHFDYAGREIRAMHQAFDGNWVYRDTLWDTDGRKVAITRPTFKEPGSHSSIPTVTFSYDERDREIVKTEPSASGGTASFTTRYSGLTSTMVDAKGNEKTITYNVLGHITKTTEPLGAYQEYINYPDGKLRQTADSSGNRTEIRYDNLGHRTYLDDPDMGKWSYNYNVFGELEYKRDANGVVTNISYNDLGQKKAEKQGNQTSSWSYFDNGLLKAFVGNGNSREFIYDNNGLVSEIVVKSNGKTFKNRYTYDSLERVATEVRPNSLKLEYLYNPYGYHAAVRSPKEFADNVFNSPSFKADIQKLIDEALEQANAYLAIAEDYADKQVFFANKAGEYASREIDLHQLDSQSIQLLKDASRYKRYCTADGECYLQAATWVLLHDDVTVPLDIDLEQYFKLDSQHSGTKPGRKLFDSTVYRVDVEEFNSRNFNSQDEWLLTDYDRNGLLNLIGRDDVYGAGAGSDTRNMAREVYSSDDLSLAAEIASSRYQYYYQLADKLVSLAEQVGDLFNLYCDDANRLAGNSDQIMGRRNCVNDQEISQVDHLQTVLTQAELEDASGDKGFIYYWQRQNTDAYDHTLAETLGNGLVNSYVYNQATGRPNAIATHWGSSVVSQRNHLNIIAGQNKRFLRYYYDEHNNVVRRDDFELGISESFEYDALDRLRAATPMLDKADRHGPNNPDFNRRFNYDYDKLGNLIGKTDIGAYEYDGKNAGPHAVTKANGISFTYDNVGNLVKGETGTAVKTTERLLEWSSFNKPTKIVRNGHTIEFAYDANYNRYYRKDSSGSETYYFDKLYEQVTDLSTGEVQHKQFIYADGKLIALNIQKHDSDNHLEDRQIRYLHYDALGSVDMITDGYGFIVERRSYDPWGKTRNIQWADEDDASTLRQFTLTNRGYTGHEQLPEVGMIHMNGRVYDQELGRFLSADPIIKSPYMTNSFNRYSYVTNNPLKYVDPTGFVLVEGSGQDDGLGRTSVDLGGPKDQRRESNRNNGRDRHHQGSDTSKNNSLISEPVDEQQITYSEIPSVESQAIINVIDEAIDYVTNIRAIEQGYYEVLNATRENFIGTLGSVSFSIGIAFIEKKIPGPNVTKGANSTLSRSGAFKEAKLKAGVPRNQHPDKVYKEKIRDQDGHVEGRVYEFKRQDGSTATIREHSLGHKLDNHGPHFNSEVRSADGIKQSLGGNGDSHTYFN
ncbi:type IV secretion protein Rhs [Photobacterium gaetbulicola]|uniref:HNH/Endo VII superfamily nuclease toxins domain-containing protein n=1 Tax=Photobacterium gaetbulicola Gung47 TaxID=658445 RepID=A0A0C5WKU7_9GAMM|nr:RHS repeat-associated core domain-containing protein [Photobacterium gaetbulicola]AJR05714.1 hypothetical protein H744_1c0689 [Photobacterium gaetbulicola Gung47]PSU14684.1 type IV secretion protein Rhs [Photobacterium gaetbulicola]